jgi:predicted metalloprotease with PDZ domain
VLLYPEQPLPLTTPFHASVRLPAGWKLASALPVESHSDSAWVFGAVPLETLIDSPVIAGAHFAEYPLGNAGGAPHFFDVVAGTDEATELSPDRRKELEQLTVQANALWGARHYSSYRFLAANAEDIAHFGLEHHQSSDDRSGERTFLDDEAWYTRCDLYPHEFTHSWCGKYRRPAGEVVKDYQVGQKTDLVWVYEGLTEHIGELLTARSGLWTPERYRDHLALEVTHLQETRGRSWRPLVDTAVAAQNLYHARDDWQLMRRDVDFYEEGDLLWTEVDMRIRKKSAGKKSLDDFCRIFAGGKSGPPEVRGYDEDEVVRDLNQVVPDDWRGLLDRRLNATTETLPLDGLEASGWRIAWSTTASDAQLDWEKSRKRLDLLPSIGLWLDKDDGTILDVLPGSPADKAGIAPSGKIIGFDGRTFDEDLVHDVVKASAGRKTPIQVVVEDGVSVRVHEIDYHGGARFPHLERIPGSEDLLSKMIAPLSAPPSPPAPEPRR